MSMVPMKEKIIVDRYLKAEAVRNQRVQSHKEVEISKLQPIIKLQRGTFIITTLEETLGKLMSIKKKTDSINELKKNSEKLHDSILLHRKILKTVIKQESKIIRKQKSQKPRKNPLPYLKSIKKRLLSSLDKQTGSPAIKENESVYNHITSKTPDIRSKLIPKMLKLNKN